MKSLHKILSAHIKKLQRFIVLMEAEAGEEVVHDFRVEFKKLRALLRLSNKTPTPPALKVLYAAAGRLRELQLQQQAMQQKVPANKAPGFYTVLNKQLQFAADTLKQKAGINYDKVFNKIAGKFPKNLSEKQIRSFLHKKKAALLTLVQLRNKKDEDIHEARKLVKDIMYSFHTIEQLKLTGAVSLTAEDKLRLHILSDELGKFQDCCTLLSLLKLSKYRLLPEAEKNLLRQTRVSFMALKQETKKTILIQLNEFALPFCVK